MDYKPFEVKFSYTDEARTVLIAPSKEAAAEGALALLKRQGVASPEITSVTEMPDTPPEAPVLN